MADISKIKTIDGTTYDIKDIAGRKEANLEWGGKNFTASYGPIDAAMIGSLGANRLELAKAAGIVVEYSRDNGTTWIDYELTDDNKRKLISSLGCSVYLGKYSSTDFGNVTTDWKLRITLVFPAAGTYTVLNKFAIYMSTQGANGPYVTIDGCKKSNESAFTVFAENVPIDGWSGWNIINTSGITTYANTTSQYSKIRFTFGITSVSQYAGDPNHPTYHSAINVQRILGFGGVGWTVPTQLAANGHLYSYDVNQNATFPAKVTATEFVGNIASSKITGTLGVDHGGTGKTTAKDAANAFMNALDTGSSTPVDADYYISQYVSGGTTTTTYHRRPMSALWEYVRSKISSVLGLTSTNYGGTSAKATADASGNTITSYYAPKSTAVTNVALATNKITKTINGTTTDVVTAATTSTYGITKLNTATNSTSTTEAATPSAVKTAYDLAGTANTTANTALSGVNGNLIYDHTFTISNGIATFTPHVYQKGQEVTTNYAKSCFTWKYRLINGSEVTLTTKNDRGCDVTITDLGYGGHVIGIFTPT